jgi:biotin-(acetyl-CoA carboxylase) ligase
MKFKPGLVLILCGFVLPCLAHAQTLGNCRSGNRWIHRSGQVGAYSSEVLPTDSSTSKSLFSRE